MSALPRSRHHGDVDEILSDWPDDPTEIAEDMIAKYGQPDEVAPSRLIWHENGPWRRTELHREGVPHAFPKPHEDYLEQVVDYHVPPEKADELADFDGSIVVDRTKGEMRARCDKESMNILSLNLAHDIVTGDTDVDEARKELAVDGLKEAMGGSPPDTADLRFDASFEEGDPDEEVVDEGGGTSAEGQGAGEGPSGREGTA